MKALVLMLAMAGVLGVAPAPVCDSGMAGRAILGPLCPVERPGMVCSRPLAATLRVNRADGSFVADVRSDAQGRFALGVPQGSYTVVPLQLHPNSTFPYGRNVSVKVAAHAFTWIDVYYDTGIR
jgi:hypothetical protein